MHRERVTLFLGQFVGPPDREDTDRIYHQSQWLAGHLFRTYREEFFVPPVLRRERGEILGLLRRPDASYRVCALFNEELFPGYVRFSIVRGILEVPEEGEETARVGRVGDRARQMLGRARSAGWCYIFDLGDEVPFNAVLTEMASLVHSFRSLWSDRQNNVIRLYRELGRQTEVAERLGITQQAVSDILRRARWREVKRAEKLIEGILKGI